MHNSRNVGFQDCSFSFRRFIPVYPGLTKLLKPQFYSTNTNTWSQQNKPYTNLQEKPKPAEQATALPAKPETKNEAAKPQKQTEKTEKNQQRRTQNYRKVNQRSDFYKNQRYDTRFMHNRHPYHYLATGPIN